VGTHNKNKRHQAPEEQQNKQNQEDMDKVQLEESKRQEPMKIWKTSFDLGLADEVFLFCRYRSQKKSRRVLKDWFWFIIIHRQSNPRMLTPKGEHQNHKSRPNSSPGDLTTQPQSHIPHLSTLTQMHLHIYICSHTSTKLNDTNVRKRFEKRERERESKAR